MDKIQTVAAPMAGITDKPMRKMLRLFGSQLLFSEMIGIDSFLKNESAILKQADIQGEENIAVQLVGFNAEKMGLVAKIMADKGATKIYVNMGCPIKKLVGNFSGSRLLLYPEKAALIIEQIKKTVSVPVGVKMRIGWDKEHLNGKEFARLMENAGTDEIIVHGRTKTDMYQGLVNLDYIKKINETVNIPVFANGDITDTVSAATALKKTNCVGVVVGRALRGTPWKLKEIEQGKVPDFSLQEIVLHHFDLLLDWYKEQGVLIARKHLNWYSNHLSAKNKKLFWEQICTEKEVQKIKQAITVFFEK